MRGSEGLRMRYPRLYEKMTSGGSAEVSSGSIESLDAMNMFEMKSSVPVPVPGQRDGWTAEPGSAK